MARRFTAVIAAALAVLALSGAVSSYSTYARWASVPVTFYVNPANQDVSANAAAAAVEVALNVWSASGSSFRYQYGGTAHDTAIAFDNRNVLLFRNVDNGSTIATTYSWWNSSKQLLDSDVIMWDGGFRFFTGTAGCGTPSKGVYIEDIATHELGHALGLNHSSSSGATMSPSSSYCSQAFRTLAADDTAGVSALYPPSAPVNLPPAVTIAAPAHNASFVQGTSISFSGTASDPEDGALGSTLTWTDNGTAMGTGSPISTVLNVIGPHTIVATATDSGGLKGSSQIALTITPPSSPSATLTAAGKIVSGLQRVYLSWAGLTAVKVDIYRNATKIKLALNDGASLDLLKTSVPGTYAYRVCVTGTQSCTNTAVVTF